MKQKTWLITGATRGIGAAIAKAALDGGDKVVVTGREISKLQSQFASYGDKALALTLDVNDEAQAQAAVKAACAQFGSLDVLVNNAGYGQLGLFEEISTAEIRQQFDTNVYGSMNMARAVLPVMREQRGGHIFNLSSIGGIVGFESASVYCASKFAIEGFSESLALEVARFGIHITIVEPGFFRTDFLDQTSVRYGDKTIADYASSGINSRETFASYNHQQAGDPVKLGAAVLAISNMAEPPLRYAAGSDAIEVVAASLEKHLQELQLWRVLSVSTDGDFK
ncbi:MAG: oxidoreductase [Undibacterium umbellatum]|uniref:oxidoreductase n=1 Tax=Undibacterium umbellatum TaxID=2762300 RepID=UPI003BB77FC8